MSLKVFTERSMGRTRLPFTCLFSKEEFHGVEETPLGLFGEADPVGTASTRKVH